MLLDKALCLRFVLDNDHLPSLDYEHGMLKDLIAALESEYEIKAYKMNQTWTLRVVLDNDHLLSLDYEFGRLKDMNYDWHLKSCIHTIKATKIYQTLINLVRVPVIYCKNSNPLTIDIYGPLSQLTYIVRSKHSIRRCCTLFYLVYICNFKRNNMQRSQWVCIQCPESPQSLYKSSFSHYVSFQ